MIKIYDGMNYFRIQIETDPGKLIPRILYNKMCQEIQDVHIWVWEGVGGNNRRREKYPLYKMNRTPPAEDVFAYIDHFKKILQHSPAHQVAVTGYEGDDVIATLAKHYASSSQKVAVYSNDFDMMQLTVNENIICGAKPKDNISPSEVRLYKALVGDPADNIKGIPGFGQVAWEQCNRKTFLEICESDGICLEDLASSGVKPRVQNWVLDNHEELKNLYDIVGLYDVPLEDINSNWQAGVLNKEKANELLREFLI